MKYAHNYILYRKIVNVKAWGTHIYSFPVRRLNKLLQHQVRRKHQSRSLSPSFFQWLISRYRDGPWHNRKIHSPLKKKAIPCNVDYPVQIARLHTILLMSKCFSIFANVLPTAPTPILLGARRAGTKEDNAWLFALSPPPLFFEKWQHATLKVR